MFIAITRGSTGSVATAQVGVEVVGVVLLEEDLDLLGEERKELCGGLCDHKLLRNGNLVVSEVKGGVTVEHDGANSEVCASQINGQIQTLVREDQSGQLHKPNVDKKLPFLCHWERR